MHMKLRYRALLTVLLVLVAAAPVLAANRVATITLGRDPEPPFCIADPGGTVRIFWNIQHTTTPDYVDYKLEDPTRTIIIEHEVYDGDTGINVERFWTVPPGSVDGKYWVRIEYHSYEAGNEMNAEVTFYVCSEMGDITAYKYQDTNCNGRLDEGDLPLSNWWICIETPTRDRVCRRTDVNGRAQWIGIPVGSYRIYELPQSGWTPIGPTSYQENVQQGVPVEVSFLNYRYEDCFGACCLNTGACVELREFECALEGGTFQGVGTICTPNPCPQLEACCFPEGRCEDLLARECIARGGTPEGVGTSCATFTCPQPPGACCFTDGHCELLTELVCTERGGTWRGIGTTCEPENPCLQPQGACCFHEGNCRLLTERECAEAGGTWRGMGTTCEPVNPCPQPPGACCFADGHCAVTTQEECTEQGGTGWTMDGTCEPNLCPQPPEACCFPDGHCEFVTAQDCRTLGGTPQGFGTVCEPNSCPQPPGACCFTDGTCRLLTERECTEAGGTWRGMGTACEPENPCPQPPTGACCIGTQGDCRILTQHDCEEAGGRYQGDQSTCEPVNPCVITPTKNTTWGRIKATYR